MTQSAAEYLFGPLKEKEPSRMSAVDYLTMKTEPETVDGLEQWKVDNPTMYGIVGAAKEVAKGAVPYLRYVDPEDRSAFAAKDTQGQTNELLKEALGAELMLATGPVLKAAGAVLKPAAQRFTPNLYRAATTPIKAEDFLLGEGRTAGILQSERGTFMREEPPRTATRTEAPAMSPEQPPPAQTVQQASQPQGPLPKYAEGSAINLQRLNTSDEVKGFINQTTKEIEQSIGRRTVTWAETREQAEALGWNTRDIKKAWDKKGAFSAAEIEATRQANVNAVSDLFETLKTLPADRSQYTPELRAKLLDTMDLVKTTSQAASEAGRALNVHRRVLSNDPAFTDITAKQRILKAVAGKGARRTDDLIDALRNVDTTDPAEVNRFIYNVTKTPWQKLSDRAYELWINGLLSHPMSHIVNVSSNALTLAYTVPERALAAGVEAVRAGVAGGGRQMFLREAKQDAYSIAGGLQSAWSRFLDVAKKGDVGKLDHPVSALPDNVARFMPTRGMAAEDAFFKGFIEHTELNRLAYRKARSEGLNGDDLKSRIVELTANPSKAMLEAVANRGKYLTYQKELGEAGKWVMRGRDVVPGLKFFIPFIKTPLNIAKFGLERTPLEFPRIVAKALRGELKGAELSEQLAKPLMGSALGGTAYMLSEAGQLTGGMPKKKAEREERMNTGWQPYSVKVGDTYVSYGRMEPLGMILGLAADFSQIQKEMTKEEQYNVAAGIMGAIKNNVTDKTFMQGFANLITAVNDPGRYGKNMVKSLAGSTVPAVVAGVERSIDPNIRDAREVLDAVMARIPGAAETLPPKLTVWGDPVTRTGTPVSRFVSPVQLSKEKGSPIEKEVARLDIDVGLPGRKVGNVELEQGQYWDMVKNAGQQAKGVLNDLASQPGWDETPDVVKEKLIRSVVDRFRDAERSLIRARLISEGKIVPAEKYLNIMAK
jgi:hypothetical protein